MKSFSFQKDLFTDDELWQRERVPKQHAADVSSTLRSKSATEDGSAEPSLFCRQDAGSTLMFTSFLRANLFNALCILVFTLVGPFAPASFGAWALAAVAGIAVYWAFTSFSMRTAVRRTTAVKSTR